MNHIYKRVIVIGVDGAGIFFRDAATPRMDEIFKNGSTTYRVITSHPTISAECWGSMILGVHPQTHGLTNTIVSTQKYDVNSKYPSFFRVIREQKPDAVMASFCNWNPINYGIIEDNIGVHMDTDNDKNLTKKIIKYIDKNDFDVIFVQFDEVDGAGHSHGYGTKGHLDKITVTDGFIGQIYDKLVKKHYIEDTLFIVTADHGGTPQGGHGGDTDAEKMIFIGAAGKNVIHGDMGEKMVFGSVRDIADIVVYALGIKRCDEWRGMVPLNLFEGYKPDPIPVSDYVDHDGAIKSQPLSTPHHRFPYHLIPSQKIRTSIYFNDKDWETNTSAYAALKLTGDLTYTDGGGYFKKGEYVTLTPYKFGADSFSVLLRMKIHEIHGDPCIISNKDRSNGANCGFALSMTEKGIQFNAGDGTNRSDFLYPFPEDYKDRWLKVSFSVDRDTNTVELSYDLGEYTVNKLLPVFAENNVTFDALDVNIGQDGTGVYPHTLDSEIQSVIILNDKFH